MAAVGWGEPAPWFAAPAPVNPKFEFSSLGGRIVGLVFFGASEAPEARAFLEALASGAGGAMPERDDAAWVSFGVTAREGELEDPLCRAAFPPARLFLDADLSIARRYGLVEQREGSAVLGLRWYVLDPLLRVAATGPLTRPDLYARAIADVLASRPAEPIPAPVLVLPRILPPETCAAYIRAYEEGNALESGFMRERDGKTVSVQDHKFKRRRDVVIEDEAMKSALRTAIATRVAPQIEKAFQFKVTRVERFIVACYDAADGGFFNAHRDNTTAGTAHRRFALTINLNAEEFEGGELRFPEFGPRTYRAPTGGGVVFSCSLLHEALPVTAGRRYATLPFLYDEAAAAVRERNRQFVAAG